jgi:PA-IL-like protein
MLRNSRLPILLAMTAAVVLAASTAEAQPSVTIVLKNGQRYTGPSPAYRLDRGEVVIRTSPADEPRIPASQIAYIDFGGTAEPRDLNISGSQEAVVLRDGAIHRGQIIEFGHPPNSNDPNEMLIVYRTDGGERRVRAEQVARIYFAGSSSGGSGGGSVTPPPPAQGLSVSGQQPWTATGHNVRQGELITIKASGEIVIGGAGNLRASPAGATETYPNNPIPGIPTGALIGRIGNSKPFIVGSQRQFAAPAAGQLFLGINDSHFPDNQGSFQVEIQRGGTR